MARKPSRLRVNLTPAARKDIQKIWLWNAEHRTVREADAYEDFLLDEISKLAVDYEKGRHVPTAREFQFVTAKKSVRGNGHYIVYEVHESSVEILRLFHTRQDWQRRFIEER